MPLASNAHQSRTAAADASTRPDERAIIERHRGLWRNKPVLETVYAAWFERILAEIPRGERVLEVGAGPGFLARHAGRVRADLHWVASDYLAVPDNDLVADALHLPMRDASVGVVVGFDILHHLVRPAPFFAEARRVLRPGGTLLLTEPWLTPLSVVVYALFHQETCHPSVDPWHPFAASDSHSKEAFEGNSAIPWKIARVTSAEDWAAIGFAPPAIERLNGFAYLLSLGFRAASLLPVPLARPLLRLDQWLQPAAGLLALRARMTWRTLP